MTHAMKVPSTPYRMETTLTHLAPMSFLASHLKCSFAVSNSINSIPNFYCLDAVVNVISILLSRVWSGFQ